MISANLQGGQFSDSQESRVQAAKRSCGCCDTKGLWFADANETGFQGANNWNMANAVKQGGQLATSQESRFQAAKRSDMSSAILQEGRFADAQESRIQAAKRSEMTSVVP